MYKRASCILLHVTSLPSSFGIGDLGPAAYQFVDFLVKAKQHFWQILPINPTDGINGHSPYSSYSAYAGNPLLISPDLMQRDGWLTKNDFGKLPKFKSSTIEYPVVVEWKEKLVRSAFYRFQKGSASFETFRIFCETQQHWLDDFAVFNVAKSQFDGRPWSDWPKNIKLRDPKALNVFAGKFSKQILPKPL